MPQLVRDVMTAHPTAVPPGAPVQQVAAAMRDENVSAVLVVKDGRLRGLVTDRDLTVRVLSEGGDAGTRTVDDVCSGELVAVAPDDDIDRAVQLMLAKALDRLPVVDDGRPVGVMALGDLVVERDPDSTPAYAGATTRRA